VQFYNWLWGNQSASFIPITCITGSIVIAYSKISPKAKIFTCIVLCTTATFSFANGIISWFVVFPAFLASGASRPNSAVIKKKVAMVWAAAFALNAAAYFYSYAKPPSHPSLLEAFGHPIRAILYFLSFLGSPISSGNPIIATGAGFCLICLWLASNLSLLTLRKKEPELMRMATAWAMIGLYAILTAGLVTVGRSGFGMWQSMSSRYTTFSVYLIVSLIPLAVVFIGRPRLKRLVFILLAIFIFLQIKAYGYALGNMAMMKRGYQSAKACLLFLNVLPQTEFLNQMVYPDINSVKARVNTINKMGFLKPGLVNTSDIGDIAGGVKPGLDYGCFDGLNKVDADTYVASGWAVLPEAKRPADAVILAYGDTEDALRVFMLVYEMTPRKDAAKIYGSAYLYSGWKKSFSIRDLPVKAAKISAWAFDADKGKAYKLNKSYPISGQF